jgi:hypothetical protein
MSITDGFAEKQLSVRKLLVGKTHDQTRLLPVQFFFFWFFSDGSSLHGWERNQKETKKKKKSYLCGCGFFIGVQGPFGSAFLKK